MSSDKINCSQIFEANVRANNLKLTLVEKYLSQENALLHLQLNLLGFSKVCSFFGQAVPQG